MRKGATFEVRYRTLNWDGEPVTMSVYRTGSLQGVVTEADALTKARERATELRNYHMFVDILRIGPRGGETFVD